MVAGVALMERYLDGDCGVFIVLLNASSNRVVLMLSWYTCDIASARVGFDSRGMQMVHHLRFSAHTDQQDHRRLLPYRCLVWLHLAFTMMHWSNSVYSRASRNAAPSPIRRVVVRS
jgi:hypothetical protein